MRFSNIVPFLLAAAAPVAVSAAGKPGFSLGAQNPDGSCKQTSDYEQDFETLKPHAKLVRTYSADQCDTAKNILPAARKKGFKVVLAVWLVSRIYFTVPSHVAYKRIADLYFSSLQAR